MIKIGIVNNNLGNVASVYSAFNFYDYSVSLIDRPEQFKKVDFIVLTGVGTFRMGISKLKKLDLLHGLNEEVLRKKKPVLGICLGMQMFADVSHENGENAGLGWIKGEVRKIDGRGIKVPHMGWDLVRPKGTSLFSGIIDSYFYFMHSYCFVPKNKKVVKAVTRYGDMEIVSVLKQDNIVGVQFHPEKSQGDGLRFLRNVIEEILC